ncbi:DUF262 domain-containing protein [Campylobacter sp. RM16704]|uniref:DUF262 domain-containing protein n=1 Tax=Campylobacter sp. RM16704 TaxID=1500960 RepID=UPI00057E2F50|nr:DUF262 domain-containing protein [Campylobacter sp. RM16704]AJC86594.1 putative protein (DUF262, DUF1524 domains) [Campylobacter sp. RM16704]
MENTILSNTKSVEECLKQTYNIDFYQREYVWSRETAKILLDDIFYNFDLCYEEYKNSDIKEEVISKYNWYYLNVYVINNIDGKKYIVDGQQRLSTLTLIASKLHNMMQNNNKLKGLGELLGQCVYHNNGYGCTFNIDNNKRQNIMSRIFKAENVDIRYNSKTEENLAKIYNYISTYFDIKFQDNDLKKLQSFALYFLKRLTLVELSISQNDTPMIFEVINDRGQALKPFEILKGKLIGVLNKTDTDRFCEIWDIAFKKILDHEDEFFIDFIKSKFIFKRNSELEKNINNYYHRFIFENNSIADNLKLRKQDKEHILNIKSFIEKDISYYVVLYAKIIKSDNEFLRYCKDINSLSGQYQNILAACKINDIEEKEKIETIAKEYDRLWVLLKLNGIYDSNSFQEITYSLSEKLKNANLQDYQKIFDDTLRDIIKNKKNLLEVISLLDYQSFASNNYSNTAIKFLRYLLARVEKFICDSIGQTLQNDVVYISTKNIYHIEHILAHNQTNIKYFDNEEDFKVKRNFLGGLLLLNGKVNISSSNEEYDKKLNTYSGHLVWAQSLCKNFYHKNVLFLNFNEKFFAGDIKFEPYDKFDQDALEKRTKLLYQIVKIIWEVDR